MINSIYHAVGIGSKYNQKVIERGKMNAPNTHNFIRPMSFIWKLGNIVALFKKGAKTDPGNYRPVSLTSIICKLMEKLVRNQIVSPMTKSKLF